MLASPNKARGTTEAAFIIPPTLFEDHELHPQVYNLHFLLSSVPMLIPFFLPQGLSICTH